MNYLAHLYLSGNDGHIQIGNFIGDFVKGSKFHQHHPERVAFGIQLHRKIDSFTDRHPAVTSSVRRLRKSTGKLAGVAADILYDHILATNWATYQEQPLPHFAQKAYENLQENQHLLPARVVSFLPHMIENNWLVNYATNYGLARSLEGISRRVQIKGVDLSTVPSIYQQNKSAFLDDFHRFFPEIIEMVKTEIDGFEKT